MDIRYVDGKNGKVKGSKTGDKAQSRHREWSKECPSLSKNSMGPKVDPRGTIALKWVPLKANGQMRQDEMDTRQSTRRDGRPKKRKGRLEFQTSKQSIHTPSPKKDNNDRNTKSKRRKQESKQRRHQQQQHQRQETNRRPRGEQRQENQDIRDEHGQLR